MKPIDRLRKTIEKQSEWDTNIATRHLTRSTIAECRVFDIDEFYYPLARETMLAYKELKGITFDEEFTTDRYRGDELLTYALLKDYTGLKRNKRIIRDEFVKFCGLLDIQSDMANSAYGIEEWKSIRENSSFVSKNIATFKTYVISPALISLTEEVIDTAKNIDFSRYLTKREYEDWHELSLEEVTVFDIDFDKYTLSVEVYSAYEGISGMSHNNYYDHPLRDKILEDIPFLRDSYSPEHFCWFATFFGLDEKEAYAFYGKQEWWQTRRGISYYLAPVKLDI